MPDTPARRTLLQRAVMWILHALMFYVVALYPNYLMAGFQPDDVVHYGFLRWIAVVLVLYWAALQLFFTDRPVDTRPGRQTLAVTAAILLIIGTFTPMVSFSFVGDVAFFREGYGDGYILLIMAVVSLALAVTGRWKQVLVPALGSLAVILWTFLSVQDTISATRSGGTAELAGNPHEGLAPATMASIRWEWGWVLLFTGSGLLVYSAGRKDRPEPEYPPLVSVAAEDEPESAGEETVAEEIGTGTVASAPVAVPSAGAVEAGTDESAAEGPAPEPEAAAPESAAAPPAAEAADPGEPQGATTGVATRAPAPVVKAATAATAEAETEPAAAGAPAEPEPAETEAEASTAAPESTTTPAAAEASVETADPQKPETAAAKVGADDQPATAPAQADDESATAPARAADDQPATAPDDATPAVAAEPPATAAESSAGSATDTQAAAPASKPAPGLTKE